MDAQESKIYIAIIVAVVVLSMIALSFFYAMLKQHKKVLRLERENARAQVELLEKDRARIAEDLHDDLAPMLAAVRMKVNSFDLDNDIDRERLLTTNSTIDDIAKRMRAISFDLMPSSLQSKGLEKAVAEFINYLGPGNPLNIRFIGPSGGMRLDDKTTIHLYRIIQEIIHNTMKHAKANELIIAMKRENSYLVLASEDNGIGFDHQGKFKEAKGLGLKSLQNRINLLRGKMEIDSLPGKGTKISVQIPLRNE